MPTKELVEGRTWEWERGVARLLVPSNAPVYVDQVRYSSYWLCVGNVACHRLGWFDDGRDALKAAGLILDGWFEERQTLERG